MNRGVDCLLSQYENGEITRRELLGALTALVAAAPVAVAAAEPPIPGVKLLNHVTLFVENVQRSVEFYQKLFGMPVLTTQGAGVNLKTGSGFVGIFPGQAGGAGSINHFCLGVDNFDADAVLRKLTESGVKGSIRMRGNTKELYFTDPDNIRVQLQHVRYKGGEGPLGDLDPK